MMEVVSSSETLISIYQTTLLTEEKYVLSQLVSVLYAKW
jgi:hypothetical protein